MAYSSAINLKNIKKSVYDLESSAQRSRKVAKNVGQSILDSNRRKRKAISSGITTFNKRREAVKRREREDIIEASSIGGILKRTRTVTMSSTKGFLGRILDFVGTLLVGWAINNLPNIIKTAERLMGRMQDYFAVLREFTSGFQNFASTFGSTVVDVSSSLLKFDFKSTMRILERSMSSMQDSFREMDNSVSKAYNMLREDVYKLLGIEEIPEIETPTTPSPYESGPSTLPDQQSPEMYRIAAALSTEGSGSQSTVDMMQVVVNRKATGRYGATYTDILSAGTGGNNVAFQGVWVRPGGPKAFRKINTLEDAAKWSGQSKSSLLRIISDIQNPTLQQNAAKFVGGALEFRASPQNNPNGRLPGTAWRGGRGDNQFLVDPSRGDPLRKEGAAPFRLPKPIPKAKPRVPDKNIPMPDASKPGAPGIPGDPKSPKIGEWVGSSKREYSTQLAQNIKNGKPRRKTDVIIVNTETKGTKVPAVFPVSPGNALEDHIALSDGVNSMEIIRLMNLTVLGA